VNIFREHVKKLMEIYPMKTEEAETIILDKWEDDFIQTDVLIEKIDLNYNKKKLVNFFIQIIIPVLKKNKIKSINKIIYKLSELCYNYSIDTISQNKAKELFINYLIPNGGNL